MGPNETFSIQYPGSTILDVDLIVQATKSWKSYIAGADNSLLLEILFGRTNDEMKLMKVSIFI